MTPATILDQVRYICKVSANDGSGGETALLRMLNDAYLRLATVFVDTNDDLFGVKMKTTLAVNANQEYYYLPVDSDGNPALMKIKRVEVTYDGTNWNKVTLIDDNEFQQFAMDPTSINNNFTQNQPCANIFGNIIYMRPIPAQSVSLALRLYGIQRPGLITNISMNTINIPAEYHGYLVYGIAGEVATRQGDQTLAAAMFQKWEDGQNKVKQMFAPRELDYRLGFQNLPNFYS